MIGNAITKIFGTKHDRDTKRIMPIVHQINELYEECADLPDEKLRAKTDEFKSRIEERTKDAHESLRELRARLEADFLSKEREEVMGRIGEVEEGIKRL